MEYAATLYVPIKRSITCTHSNDWIDAAKRWYEYQDISQKKQNFCTCLLSLRENYIDIEVQSYLKKKSKYGKIADEKCKIGYEY